ncbi:tubulin polyglutamylase TTLL13-like isoform X2 [Hypanus sabinus]|uniref:tubulin polyglutamylase TTLL13-like isoform X2 n=1 Tax=Hypanus sabinus TaxID=79690 RepID=UPI0028C4D459|nr:tubulin polyglutamylase TTLL13-like isoform X2 [Hypanus sabinus]
MKKRSPWTERPVVMVTRGAAAAVRPGRWGGCASATMNAPGGRSDSEGDSVEEEAENEEESLSEGSEDETESTSKVDVTRNCPTAQELQQEVRDEEDLHKQELDLPKQKSKEKKVKEEPVKKKKKRRRSIGINLINCKYESVRRAARRYGLKEVGEDEEWILYWTDTSVSHERVMEMKRFQKINHFPGMSEICRKDLLARNLNRMLKLFPKEYNIFPRTWCLPADFGDFQAYCRTRKPKTYICKPDCGCQGRGIFITRNLKEIKHGDRMICQHYISKPFLIDGFKFDLRIYILVTSCDPFRIYIYNEGLARFATSKYIEPSSNNLVNHSPSFTTDSRLDREVKDNLLYDTISLINLGANNKQKAMEEERRRVQERLWQRHSTRESRREQYENQQLAWLQQVEKYEKEHLGGFRLIYPLSDSKKYDDFFKQSGSLFQETVASRAREECARQQLEEIRQKNEPKELAKGRKVKDPKDIHLHGESGGEASTLDRSFRKYNHCLSMTKEEAIDSMKPLKIIDEEELQRLSGLLHRENLLRALGVIEQVYRVLRNTSGVSGTVQTAPSDGTNKNKSLICPSTQRSNQMMEELEYVSSSALTAKNSATELGVLNPTTVNWSTLLSPHGQAPGNNNRKRTLNPGNGFPLHRFQNRFPVRRGLTWVGGNQLPVSLEAIAVRTASSSELRLNAVSAYPRSVSAKLVPENSLLQSKASRGSAMLLGSGSSHSSAVNAMRVNGMGKGTSLWHMKMNAANPSPELTVVSAQAPMNQRAHLTRRANLLSLFQSDCRRRLN